MSTAETIEDSKLEAKTLDMSDYIMATSEASTKNDIMHKHMIDLNKTIQNACGFGYTAIVVDQEASSVLGTNKDHFHANGAFLSTLDGLIGDYDGVPVIRHHALDKMDGYGYVYGLFKDPNGALAQN